MDKLPTELLDHILEQAGFPEVAPAIQKRFGKPNASLKALRLCSKDLAERMTPRLFDTILVFITPESFAKLTAIARHPEHRYLVKAVHTFPRRFAQSSPFEDKSAYRSHVNTLPIWDTYHHPENTSRGGSLEWTSEPIADPYVQYERMRYEQSKLLPRVQSLLQEAFSQFSNLQTVVASSQYILSNDTSSQFSHQLPTSLRHFLRKTLLNISGDRFIQSSYPYAFDRESAAETATVVRALALSSATVQDLDLCGSHSHPDLGLFQVPRRQMPSAKSMFAKLKKLTFPMPGWRFEEEEHSDIAIACTATWNRLLKSASNVEMLKLMGHRHPDMQYERGIVSIYGDAYFPRLRRLELRYFSTTRAAFSAFVVRHASTLRELVMDEIILEADTWYGIFTDIRRHGLKVRVHCLLSVNHHPEYFFDNERLVHNEMLDAFIQGGQAWPSDLPAGLSRGTLVEFFG